MDEQPNCRRGEIERTAGSSIWGRLTATVFWLLVALGLLFGAFNVPLSLRVRRPPPLVPHVPNEFILIALFVGTITAAGCGIGALFGRTTQGAQYGFSAAIIWVLTMLNLLLRS